MKDFGFRDNWGEASLSKSISLPLLRGKELKEKNWIPDLDTRE
jgi:hypothetical protein